MTPTPDESQATADRILCAHGIRPDIEDSPDAKCGHGPGVELILASTIQPKPIKWIWHGWLAGGKLHIVAGAPGTGKSSVAFAIAATVTSGGRFPDGTRATPGNVLIWSGEDDPEDTIIPRLLASGADLGRCYIVGDVIDGQRRPFDPSVDMPRLQKAAAAIPGGADLMLVDPVVSAVLGDSHKNAEVRRSLQPLVDLASSLGAAVLGITHHTKGTQGRDPVERVTGSIAFGALARIVFAVARMPEDQGGGRVFCRSKSNIGEDSGGFEYDLELVDVAEGISCTAVCWAGPVEGTARDILAKAEAVQDDPDQRSELDEAKEFLLNILADSDLSSKQVRADADGAGHAWRTVERAQKALGIQPYKKGMKEGWFWTLEARRPPKNAEDRHKKAWRSSNNNGGLRACGLDRDEDYDLTEGAV